MGRELYEHQEFSYAGPCGDYGFLEDYTTEVRGVHLSVAERECEGEVGQGDLTHEQDTVTDIYFRFETDV